MFRLRPFVAADYDAVFALWRGTEGIGLGDSDTREAITAYLTRNPGMSAVAVTADAAETIVGAVLCGHDGRRGTIHHLAVAPAYRRRGVARALVDRSLSRLNEAGILKCNIFVWNDNDEGAAFWKREGWAPRGDLVVMQHWTSEAAAASAARAASGPDAAGAGGCGTRDC